MANQQYEQQKYQLKNSKNKIKNAGRNLRKGATGELRDESIAAIQDYRSSHSYPLMLIKNHLWRQSKKVAINAIVARRLKRLPTIINKLERKTLDGLTPNAIEVVRMQDIGGCRAIFDNYGQITELIGRLHKSKCVHEIKSTVDYNLEPRESGYRGVHLVFDCYRHMKNNNPWRGHKIEVQVRTRLQHAWSTAVEMIDFFEGTELKTGTVGDEDWRRFFYLLGAIFSHLDGIEDIKAEDVELLTQEVIKLENELDITTKLNSYNMVTDTLDDADKESGAYLISIHRQHKAYEAIVRWFPEKHRNAAVEQYDLLELEPSVYQVVLVGAENAKEIKQAYPNFFADTSLILRLLSKITNKKINIPFNNE